MYLEALGNNCCRLSWLTCANDWFKKIGIWGADACQHSRQAAVVYDCFLSGWLFQCLLMVWWLAGTPWLAVYGDAHFCIVGLFVYNPSRSFAGWQLMY